MRREIMLLLLAAVTMLPVMAQGTKGVGIRKTNGETLHIANAAIKSMRFEGEDAVLVAVTGEVLAIKRSEIILVTPVGAVETQYRVQYDDNAGVSVINPYALQGVSTVIDGGYVTTTNVNESEELSFTLCGRSQDGAFTYNGSHKCTIRLAGVDISSKRGAAVDVRCGKRIVVELVDGTVNSLADCAGGEHKAALYFKGHPEFEKGGVLNVTGNTGHAIASKEYMLLKKTVGEVNIPSARNDAIHAGQYFMMNGGKVTVTGVDGDGIQAEATNDVADELNGQLVIKGGTLDISVPGPTADCLKADSLITIAAGEMRLTTTGNGVEDKAGGLQYAPQLGPVSRPGGGGGGWPPGGGSKVETSSPKCINGGWDIVITGGTIDARSTGKGGKCIVADGLITIGGEGMEPGISCVTTGGVVAGSGENLSGQPKAMKAQGDIVINSGMVTCSTSQNGGEGIESKSRIIINGGTVVCNTYDDGINAARKITVNGGVVWSWAQRNDGMDCNGQEGFELNGGIIVANGSASPEEGLDCDRYSFAINGGTILGVGGAASEVTQATQPFALTTGVNITQGRYLSMVDGDGNVIFSYLCPVSLSSARVVNSSPAYGNGVNCKLVYGASAIENPDASHLDGRFLVGGTLTGGTAKVITPRTK